MFDKFSLRATTCAFAILLSLAGTALAQEKVGVTGAVNPATTGEPPNEPARTLYIGNDVVFNERIQTVENGQAQLLFLDKSSLTVGPKSDMVIDKFVYDPNAGTGQLVANVSKGVFRFVGGALSKGQDGVSLKTGSATIGVRGGMLGLKIADDGAFTVVKYFGDYVEIKTPQGTQRIYRNDYYLSVNAQGEFGQSRPLPATAETLSDVDEPLTPPPGTNGGSNQAPPNEIMVRQAYAGGNSGNPYQVRRDAGSHDPTPAGPLTLASAFGSLINSPDLLNVARTNSANFPSPSSGSGGFVTGVGGSGLIRAQLIWTVGTDLDLHLILPNNLGEVFFAQPSITFNNGGATATLDHDNVGPTIDAQPNQRIENIRITGSNIPAGTYNFFVRNFSGGTSPFTLNATGNGGQTTQTLTGTLTNSGQNSPTLSVTSPGGSFVAGNP